MENITTERLVLKPMSQEYLESTHEYASDPENTEFMVYLPSDSIQDTLYYLIDAENEFRKESPSYYEMAVFLGDRHIGAVSLYLNEERTSGEFGWTIIKRYQGCGYAHEAAAALLGYAVEVLGIRHFTAHCDTENIPSQRVMKKLGMELREEHGGRKNKLSDEERREYLFDMDV